MKVHLYVGPIKIPALINSSYLDKAFLRRGELSTAAAVTEGRIMDLAAQVVVPVLGIAAAAAVTFYAVSFMELREKSFRELDESESSSGGGFQSSASSRERRARRKAEKEARK